MASTPILASLALAITEVEWTDVGLKEDPTVGPTNDLDVTVERVTALLLIRIVAIVAPEDKYQDLSTTTICRKSLAEGKDWEDPMTDTLIDQIRLYVKRILSQYQDVPYHNFEHAYHVVISAHKLLDLMLNWEMHGSSRPNLWGLRKDPLMQFLLIFAALIHDVEHLGIPNRTLAVENNELAILYNDQSIAENRSLCIGFNELLKEEFSGMRAILFKSDDDYRRFRKACVEIVLVTDIASPERTQIRKSKWKEAFGEEFDTMERKIKYEMKHRASGDGSRVSTPNRRASAASIISNLKQLPEMDSPSNTPDNSESGDNPLEDSIYGDLSEYSDQKSDTVPGVGTYTATAPGHRSASMPFTTIQKGDEPTLGYNQDVVKKFQRRMSASAAVPVKHRVRLGISRSMDLSGVVIETYRRATMDLSGVTNTTSGEPIEEEPDELKVTVLFETIITAADVAHNLQGWGQMVKFADRLFLELQKANSQGRGFDPKPGWYDGQIGFLESYLLPLARRLEDTGAFGTLIGPVFAKIVESNRDTWVTKGQEVTDNVIAKAAELYPPAEKSG